MSSNVRSKLQKEESGREFTANAEVGYDDDDNKTIIINPGSFSKKFFTIVYPLRSKGGI